MDNKDIKKLNKEKIKEYKKQLNLEVFNVENELNFNENDEAIIECKIGQAENIFSKYDILKDRSISDEFNNYLMDETEIIPLRHSLELRLHTTEDIKEDTANQITKAIKRHYSFNITKLKVNLRNNTFIATLLYVLGIVALFAIPFVQKIYTGFPITEFLLILVWFCIWEASDLAIFRRGKMRVQRINMLRLYNAKVTFVKDKNITPVNTVIMDKATIISDKSTVYTNKSSIKHKVETINKITKK